MTKNQEMVALMLALQHLCTEDDAEDFVTQEVFARLMKLPEHGTKLRQVDSNAYMFNLILSRLEGMVNESN